MNYLSFNKFLLIFTIVFALSNTIGCDAPSEVSQFALSKAKEAVKTAMTTRNYQSKDFKITNSKKINITRADKANGIEAKWEVKVEYLLLGADGWFENKMYVNVFKRNGELATN